MNELVVDKRIKPTPITVCTLDWLLNKPQSRFLIHQGGTYAGKTMSTLYAIFLMMQEHDRNGTNTGKHRGWEPMRCRVAGYTFRGLRDGAIADFTRILRDNPEYNISYNLTDKTATFPNGSLLQFVSLDDPKKAHGGKFHLTFVNEANFIPYEIITELDTRSERGVIFDYNPSRPFWLHSENFISVNMETGVTSVINPKTIFYQWSYRQNLANLTPEKVEQIEGWKTTKPERYHVYGLGFLGKVEGLVFPKVALIDEAECPPLESAQFLDFGLDFGGTDPHALVLVAIHGDDVYLYEYYYSPENTSPRDLGSILADSPAYDICKDFDLRIHADTNNKLGVSMLRAHGFMVVDAQKGQDSIMNGIAIMNGFKNIFITLQSRNLVEESREYVYKKNITTGVSKPTGRHHGFDAARYVFLSRRFKKWSSSLTNKIFSDYEPD